MKPHLERELLNFLLWLTPCGEVNPGPSLEVIGKEARRINRKILKATHCRNENALFLVITPEAVRRMYKGPRYHRGWPRPRLDINWLVSILTEAIGAYARIAQSMKGRSR